MNRPAIRAALVVSGLTLGCGGAAPATHESATPNTSNEETTQVTTEVTTSNVSPTNETCDGSVGDLSEACCNQTGGRTWSEGRCLYTAVPGPFVPPSMVG
jgi:hypothetical protein